MNRFFLSIFAFSLSTGVLAAEPNFQCEIFRDIDGGGEVRGGLSLTGEDPFVQAYELSIVQGTGKEARKYSGVLHLSGQSQFTDLTTEVQASMTSAMKSSKRAGLKAGPLIVFSNAEDASEATLQAFLMPSGEIALITAGALQLLCM